MNNTFFDLTNTANMNIYRIYPGLDAFVINGVFLPYLDIIAENEDKALAGANVHCPSIFREFLRTSEHTESSVLAMYS